MDIPRIQKVIAVVWPSFITASVATIIFFSLFDPLELFPNLQISRLGCYTCGFFAFWGLTLGTSLLTCYFQRPCESKGTTRLPQQ